jgi:hypothetical protein
MRVLQVLAHAGVVQEGVVQEGIAWALHCMGIAWDARVLGVLVHVAGGHNRPTQEA